MDLIIAPPSGEGFFEPLSWFATPGPFELEIGSGKGGFLLSRARAHPEIRILGVELRNKHVQYAADRLARWQVANARLMRIDARELVMGVLPSGCVSVLHLYHPDPWPKKRHHKRRLIQPDFASAAARILKPGGRWLVQSDHDEYFAEIIGVLDARSDLVSIEWDFEQSGAGPEWGGTNFEVKYSRRGHIIHRAAYRKV